MAGRTFSILDVDKDVYESNWKAKPEDLGNAARDCSVKKRKLHGGFRDGVDVIDVDNGKCRFTVVPTRGMGIWKAWVGDLEIGWKSPNRGPVHPQFVDMGEPSGLGWLDGFDELFVRCGLTSNGAPDFDAKTGLLTYPLHGKIANKPAHDVSVSIDDETGEISVNGKVDESRFHFGKLRLTTSIRTKPGELGFRVIDDVTNISGTSGEMQMLYHINFGLPLLDAGSRVVAPVKTLVPRTQLAAENLATWDSYSAEQRDFAEHVYFLHLLANEAGNTQVLLKDGHGMRGVSLKYPVKNLPCFTIWKDTATAEDGYVTGLEPGTNFPNPRTFEGEHGRVVKLKPGETVRFEVGMEVHPDAASVSAAEAAIRKLQGNTKPQIFDKPQPTWAKMS